jgi:outer membrane lipase/esterase
MKPLIAAALAATALFGSVPATAGYSGLVVFGDSISDAGNYQTMAVAQNIPLPTAAAITDNLYSSGGYSPSGTASNGEVWAQYLSSRLGLGPMSASATGGSDYAFSGAMMAPRAGAVIPSLSEQVDQFISRSGPAPADALYVVEGGTNDLSAAVRTALPLLMSGQDVTPMVHAFITQYVTDTLNIIGKLKADGAKNIVVWDIPDVAVVPNYTASTPPALLPVLRQVVRNANATLAAYLAGAPGVTLFDAAGLMDQMVAQPAAFGLVDVSNSCVLGQCDASTNLFWDGIHFTTATHEIIAGEVLRSIGLPEPDSLLLLIPALVALAIRRRPALLRSVA